MPGFESTPIQYAEPQQPMQEGWQLMSVGTIANFRRSALLGEVATHHPVLRVVAKPIPTEAIETSATRELVDKARRTVDGELAAGHITAGLAVTQLGISRRVILVNLTMEKGRDGYDPTDLTPMINPTVTALEDSLTAPTPEGCFSCGPVAGLVERPTALLTSWYDLRGKRQEIVTTSHASAALGHESDHLDGILFPDRVLQQGRQLDLVQVEQVESGEYRTAVQTGETWPTAFPNDQWQAMKRPDGTDKPTFRLAGFSIPE